jgi:hypothetical protein
MAEESLLKLIEALPSSHLQDLELTGSELSEKAGSALAKVLPKCPRLRVLDVRKRFEAIDLNELKEAAHSAGVLLL